jgi:hypothetical protein
MGTLATYSLQQVLFNIATSTTIAGSPTFVGGHAYCAFQVKGLTLNAGAETNNGISIQGTLGVAAVGSPSWVAMSITNINNNVVLGSIVADGIYTVSTLQGTRTPYLLYIRPLITTLSNVTDGRLDVWSMRQAEVTGSN